MAQPIVLPPGVAVAILAFLLSLLPTGMLLWAWYLRRHKRYAPASVMLTGFVLGGAVIAPAFWLETQAKDLWEKYLPQTAHYFDGAVYPLFSFSDILWPALATFLIVSLVEEGLRYLGLFVWLKKSRKIDQVFDGLLAGLAAGLGFATIENTIYFFNLFSSGNFDTLVFVFFLRFILSTMAHVAFGGIMGALLARGVFTMYRPGRFYWQAWFVPWLLHGAYDWLLSINFAMYAVLLLLVPIWYLTIWSKRRDFLVVNREDGKLLNVQKKPA